MILRSLLLGLTVIAALSSAASDRAHARNQLILGLGSFAPFGTQSAVAINGEYRFNPEYWRLRPLLGGMVTSDGAAFAYGGLGFDQHLDGRLWLSLASGLGYYHDGSGRDLSSDIQFLFSGDISHRFNSGSRLGVSYTHITNLGIGETNPQAGVLALRYLIPLRW